MESLSLDSIDHTSMSTPCFNKIEAQHNSIKDTKVFIYLSNTIYKTYR